MLGRVFSRHSYDNLILESRLEGAKLARLYLARIKGVACLALEVPTRVAPSHSSEKPSDLQVASVVTRTPTISFLPDFDWLRPEFVAKVDATGSREWGTGTGTGIPVPTTHPSWARPAPSPLPNPDDYKLFLAEGG